jgi:hypothetical protein
MSTVNPAYTELVPLDNPVKFRRIEVSTDGKIGLAPLPASAKNLPIATAPQQNTSMSKSAWFPSRVLRVLSGFGSDQHQEAAEHIPDTRPNRSFPRPPLSKPTITDSDAQHMLTLSKQLVGPATPASKKRKV